MKKWYLSLHGAITFALIALLVFLGRAFIDFYYVYGEFGLQLGIVSGAVLIHTLLFGGWIWSLLSAAQASRRGLCSLFGFNSFFFIVMGVGTLVFYCPSPCRSGWPLGEIVNWTSLIVGFVAGISIGYQIWFGYVDRSTDRLSVEAA
jgi:hypothetical protein